MEKNSEEYSDFCVRNEQVLSPSEVKIMMKYMIRIKVHNYFFIAQILKVLRAFPINAKKTDLRKET